MNDEIWVATTVDVLSGFQMNEDLISPTTFGCGETWSVCGMRFHRVELDSMSLCMELICWELQNRFGRLLINCCNSTYLSIFSLMLPGIISW